MKLPRFMLLLAIVASVLGFCPAAEQKKEEVIERHPFTHEYYWREFSVSKREPTSADGRYLLQKVKKSGEVVLLDRLHPETPETVIAKPKPKKQKAGSHPPTILVVASDFYKQSATIRALQMK